MKKKVISIILGTLAALAVGAYFGIPIIAANLIAEKIAQNPSYSAASVDITWSGPQTISGLHIQNKLGTADVDVEISHTLIDFIQKDLVFNVAVRGDLVITPFTEKPDEPKETTPAVVEPKNTVPIATTTDITIPNIVLTLDLDSLTVEGEEPLKYHDVNGSIRIDPGRVFSLLLDASTNVDGTISCSLESPDLLTEQGAINWDASASLDFIIENADLPTIEGQGGWSVIELYGQISSPKLSDSINVSMAGKLSEYDVPRGTITIKTQLLSTTDTQNMFVFNDKEIVGTINLTSVPTTILSPILHFYDIDPVRDIGNTMNLRVDRLSEGPPVRVTFTSDRLQVACIYDPDLGVINDLDVVADLHTKLVQTLTKDVFQGNAIATIHLDQLVPSGISSSETPECVGHIDLEGALDYVPTGTTIQSLQSDVIASIGDRNISANGSIRLNDSDSTFSISLFSKNKNKLDGIDDLWKTVTRQLPRGWGTITASNVPVSTVKQFVDEEQSQYLQYTGPILSTNISLELNNIDVELISDKSQVIGTVQLDGTNVIGVKDAVLKVNLSEAETSHLFDGMFKSKSILKAKIGSIDLEGNSTFDSSLDVEEKHITVRGVTTRQSVGDRAGQLDANVIATGIDTLLLDTLWNCDRLLVRSFGSPLSVEVQAMDVLNNPVIYSSGTSPNATFESSFRLLPDSFSTLPNTTTKCELQLSPQLTQHLLKDLGPILSDIRTVRRPVQMDASNVSTSLDGDIASLNADIVINIGEVALDSSSVTMKLLPMFNTKHVEIVPAFFDPIHIQIRKGIATYKKFNLTLVNKYSIPYSGTINFVNRQLNIRSAVPLTGLGYSIKELRNLATDIDVPILITGTIDNPVTQVDPNFDLNKLLQSVAITAIGDAIDDVFNSDDKEGPNPMDLLEELFGDK
ncbi:MAG: hypothetical protein H8E83_02610 [Planctomycetes bacterium]|nr:hypothetical protein [Planctomycetota bacterium]